MYQRGKSGERRMDPIPADGIPDPDSLQMDDRGTRIYRGKTGEHVPRSTPDDGNYIGDPIQSDTIRAEDADAEEMGEQWLPAGEQWLPASDAPTIIRDVQRNQ